MAKKSRKQAKTRTHRVSHSAPKAHAPHTSTLLMAIAGLVLVVGLVAGVLSLRKPESPSSSATVPVNMVLSGQATVDIASLLFGEADTVPHVRAEALKLGLYLTERFPGNDAALFLLGSVYGQQGDVDRNIALWKQVIELNPQRVDVYDKLAQLAKDREDTEQALAYWQAGLKQTPRHPNSLWALANTYLELHQPEQAIGLLQQVCAVDPKAPRNYYSLGQAYRQMQRLDEARVRYEKAVELNPE